MAIFLDVMKEELERNLLKQKVFSEELSNLPKGYLSICVINNKRYLYRKERKGSKIISIYVGVPEDNACLKAYEQREEYLRIKKSLKNLKNEENRLRKAIRDYERL